jgi:hypothetical protein
MVVGEIQSAVKLIAGGNAGDAASIILREAASMSRKLGHLSRCHHLS